jgi:hypothetical protein
MFPKSSSECSLNHAECSLNHVECSLNQVAITSVQLLQSMVREVPLVFEDVFLRLLRSSVVAFAASHKRLVEQVDTPYVAVDSPCVAVN